MVRLKGHPFVPTCPCRGIAASGGQGWPPGHRSSRRAASLRAVRGHATLGKGEDISGLLPVPNGLSKPQTAATDDTHKLRLYETNFKGLRLRCAQPRPSGRAIWVLARANGSSACPKQPTSKENCFKDQPKRLSPGVKHRLRTTAGMVNSGRLIPLTQVALPVV